MHLNAELRVSRAHVEAEVERLPKPPPGFSQIEWLELPDQ
jgi:hypothetical protein